MVGSAHHWLHRVITQFGNAPCHKLQNGFKLYRLLFEELKPYCFGPLFSLPLVEENCPYFNYSSGYSQNYGGNSYVKDVKLNH